MIETLPLAWAFNKLSILHDQRRLLFFLFHHHHHTLLEFIPVTFAYP